MPQTLNPPLRRLYGVPAPAKLNLFLHITGRRDDGYHLLQSVFMLVNWADRLDFELRHDGQLTREDQGDLLLPEDDLCLRAARALKQMSDCPYGAHIRLHKHLPAEAGLGGGSSDAATCLLALNRMWGLKHSRRDLMALGQTLGADVPFFLGGRNAWVEGIGEQVTPVSLPPTRFVVVKPGTGVSTQRIFSSPDLTRNTKPAIIAGFAANDRQKPEALVLETLLEKGRNDLQAVAQTLCPEIGHCLSWLEHQGLQGRMTGSGSAVFAPMSQNHVLPPAPVGWVVQECSNMDIHPLADWCCE